MSDNLLEALKAQGCPSVVQQASVKVIDEKEQVFLGKLAVSWNKKHQFQVKHPD